MSDYASRFFPKPGIAFADFHAALAHAMAGEADPLAKLIKEPAGPAGDVVSAVSSALQPFARQDWAGCITAVSPFMATHERLGGSRAQRDLVEFTLVAALLRSGRADDARLMLATRRPVKATTEPVAGLAA